MCSQPGFLPLSIQTTILSYCWKKGMWTLQHPLPFPSGKTMPMEHVPREAVTLQFTSLLPPGSLLMRAHSKKEASSHGWARASIIHSLLQQRNSIIQEQVLKQQSHSWKLFFLLKVVMTFWENPSPSQSTPWFLVEVNPYQKCVIYCL